MKKIIACLLAGLALLPLGCSGGESAPSPTPFNTRTPLPTFTATPAVTATPAATATLPPPTLTPTPSRPADINPFTGLKMDDPAALQRRPILVKIENHKQARPQVGLTQADLIYEYRIEYGFTRFAALFITQEPEKLGPVRSARPMDLELIPQHDSALCFSGASEPVKKMMRDDNVIQLSDAKYGSPYLFRVNRGADVAYEHTMFTNMLKLRDLLRSLNEERPAPQQGFLFDEAAPSGAPATHINIPFSTSAIVDYTYDPATKLYKRVFNGADFIAEETGQAIEMRNLIIQFVKGEESIFVNDALGGTNLYVYEMMGEGPTLVFRDGVVIVGTWQRPAKTEQTRFVDQAGNEIKLAPGHTWISCVLSDAEVTYE
ncbi:MAG: DUF3048 domain-containing protein [Chloroflexi bacterium]|nr:DUF3048 domain-containing protein [Chloroflexota bacterium]MBU1749275.1 DUF3048 domain-containing protein [Chloroflexota bacterium]